MKNRFLFVFMLLLFSFGAAVAQTPEKHWGPIGSSADWDGGMNMTLILAAQVDGEELANPNIEMASFIGEERMSEGTFPIVDEESGRYLYYLTIVAYTTGNIHHFKLYDHDAEAEMELTSTEITYFTNGWLGKPSNPLTINFYSGETRWQKVTDVSTLKNGDAIIITGNENSFAISRTQNSSNRGFTPVTKNEDGTLTWGSIPAGYDDPLQIILYKTVDLDDNEYSLLANLGYLSVQGDSLLTTINTDGTFTDRAIWNVSIESDGLASLAGMGPRYIQFYKDPAMFDMLYNMAPAAAVNFANFSCYDSSTAQDGLNIYRLTNETEEQQNYYTLEVNADLQEAATFTIDPMLDEYEEGTTVTVTAELEMGYEIIGWTLDDVLEESTNTEYQVTMDDNHVLVANLQQIDYDVTITADEAAGTAAITEEAPYHYGDEITLTYTENPGYEFVNFTVNGEEVTSPYTVTGDAEIVANFNQLEYTVTITADEAAGTAAITEEGPFHYGDVITLTYTENPGYEFVNFTVGEEEVTSPYTVIGDAEIVANFNQLEYTVTITADEAAGTAAITEEGPYHYGDEITLTYTENPGYEFVNFTVDEEEVTSPYTVIGDAEIVANFNQLEYTVTIASNNEEWGTAAIVEEAPYHYGDVITLTNTANDGYHFVNYTVNGSPITSPFTVTEDAEIIANFVENDVVIFNITTSANPTEGGTTSGDNSYAEGDEVTLTATANNGYTFENWTLESEIVSEEATYVFEASADGEYVANFTQNEYNVTIEATEGGTAAITEEGPFHYGDIITLTYEVEEGYQFVNFTVAQEVITSPYTVVGDVTILANFELIPVTPTYIVTVNINPADAGTVTGLEEEYEEGATAELTAHPAEGYQFVNWTINGEEVGNYITYSFEVADDITVTANFELIPVTPTYAITVTIDPTDAGTVTGADTYEEGAHVTLEAFPAEGYEFLYWAEGQDHFNDNPYVFEAAYDASFVAVFQLIPVTPTYTVTITSEPAVAGTTSGTGIYEEGADVTIQATENPGYEFSYWDINGTEVSENPYTINGIEENLTIVAYYEEGELPDETFTVSADPVPNGSGILTGTGEYALGAIANLKATPVEGYTFVNWTRRQQVVSTEPEYQFEVTESVHLLAHFEAIQHNVNVTVSPAIAGTVTGGGPYDQGSTAHLEASPNPGFEFNSWLIGGVTFENNPIDIQVNNTINVIAQFNYIEYEITAEAIPAEGGEATVSDGPYHYNEVATLAATEANGYQFINWTDENGNSISTNSVTTVTIEGNATYYANFEQLEYNVTITADELAGTAAITEEGPFHYGDVITLTYTENPGYEFVNFTVDGEEVAASYTVTGDAEIVANFNQLEYNVTITADAAAGTAAITEDGPYHYGDVITLTYTENEGYEFVNFTVDGEEVAASYTVTGDAEIVANFNQLEYSVTIYADADAGTAAITEDGPYHYGDVITLTYTENPGYEFENFTVNEDVVTSPYTVIGDAEIEANFIHIEYAITAEANNDEYGTVTIDPEGPYYYGDEVTVSAEAAYGHSFINWTIDGAVVSTNEVYTFNVEGNTNLIANFTLEGYAVNAYADPAEGGTVTVADGPYLYGDELTATLTVNPGYDFLGWTVNGTEAGDEMSINFTVNDNMTVIAHLALHEYNITAIANDDTFGEVSISDAPYYYNEEVTVTAIANYGYHFVNWTLGNAVVADTETATFTVLEDAEYVANFQATMYDIAATAEPTEGGEVEGAGSYQEGTMVTLNAIPAEHYYFVSWTEDDEVVSEDAEYVFEATSSRTLVANFEPITFQVTASAVPVGYGTVEGVTNYAGTFIEGSTVTLTAAPAEGYEFLYWTRYGQIITEELALSFEVTQNVNYLAHFQQIPGINYYQIVATANPEEGGTITGAGEFAEGTQVNLVATANEGYYFVSWTENGEIVAETEALSFVAEASRNLVANFAEIPVEYTITVEEVEHAEITAPATSIAGEIITVNVSLESMYRLINLYYYTTDPEDVTAIDLNTKQFIMPEADVTIGAELLLVEGKGDVNLDGEVNILDVLTTINYILGDEPQPFDFEQADMDENGVIEISDAMAINALILGLRSDCIDETATYAVVDGKLYIESEIALAGYQIALSAEPVSIDMPGFSTMGKWNNGEYIVVIFNLNGEKESGLYSIIDMGNANVNNIVMATREGCRVRGIEGTVSVASFDEANYSVYPVPANNNITVAGPNITTIDVFNMMGQKVMTVNAYSDETVVNLNNLSVGSYLFRINTTNGVTTKNVVVVR